MALKTDQPFAFKDNKNDKGQGGGKGQYPCDHGRKVQALFNGGLRRVFAIIEDCDFLRHLHPCGVVVSDKFVVSAV